MARKWTQARGRPLRQARRHDAMVRLMREQEVGDVSRIVEATVPIPTAPARRRLTNVPKAPEGGSGAKVLIRASTIAQSRCPTDSWQSLKVFRWTAGGGGFNFGLLLHHNGVWCPGAQAQGLGKTRAGCSSELVQVVEFVWPSSTRRKTASNPHRTERGAKSQSVSSGRRHNPVVEDFEVVLEAVSCSDLTGRMRHRASWFEIG